MSLPTSGRRRPILYTSRFGRRPCQAFDEAVANRVISQGYRVNPFNGLQEYQDAILVVFNTKVIPNYLDLLETTLERWGLSVDNRTQRYISFSKPSDREELRWTGKIHIVCGTAPAQHRSISAPRVYFYEPAAMCKNDAFPPHLLQYLDDINVRVVEFYSTSVSLFGPGNPVTPLCAEATSSRVDGWCNIVPGTERLSAVWYKFIH